MQCWAASFLMCKPRDAKALRPKVVGLMVVHLFAGTRSCQILVSIMHNCYHWYTRPGPFFCTTNVVFENPLSGHPASSNTHRTANRSTTPFTRSTSGLSTSITRRSIVRSVLNASGSTASKSNPGTPSSALVTASENFAGCAVERMIWMMFG